jgi:sugar lactone lactonase YvrE
MPVAFKGRWARLGARLVVGLAIAAALTVVLGGEAVAHPGHAHRAAFDGRLTGQPDFVQVGETTYRFNEARAEYEIRHPDRPTAYAHVDPTPKVAATSELAAGPSTELPSGELDPICRTSGNRIVPVFTRRSGDGTPTPTATIRGIVKRMNWKINQQSSASSGGSRAVKMVVDCNGSGEINVHNVATANYNFSTISSALSSQLFGMPSEGNAVKYLAFDSEENPSAAGLGGRYADTSKWSYNSNGRFSAVAVAYDYPGTWTSHVPVHELFHTLGASQGDSASPPPFSTAGSHCTDGLDILCYSDGTGIATETRCPAASGYGTPTGVPIDCGNDAYFDAAPAGGSWLDSKWNAGGFEDPFLIVPGAPKAITLDATSIGGKDATLEGRVNAGGHEAAYQFEYGPTASYGSKAPIPSASFGFNVREVDVEAEVEELELGTEYHYRVVATSAAGTAYGADKTFVTDGLPSVATEAVTTLNSNKATLPGVYNANGGGNNRYSFEYGTTTSYGSSTSTEFIFPEGPDFPVSETISGLEPSTTYHFRLRGQNNWGTSYSADRTFTTPAAAITEPATKIGNSGATPNGTVDPQGVATSYQLEYGKTTAYGSKAPASPGSAGSGSEPVAVETAIEGLRPNATYHFRVVATNALGTFVGEDREFTTSPSEIYGTKGTGNGQFEAPSDIGRDSAGNIWVLDTGNNRVQKLSSAGAYLSQFGSGGTGNGQFSAPLAIAVDQWNNVWVADTGNNRVQKFNSEGEYVLKFGSEGSGNGLFKQPQGVAVDTAGNVWVADTGNHRVQRFTSAGAYLEQFGTKGTSSKQFESPTRIGIRPHFGAGLVWVADTGNHRVVSISLSAGKYAMGGWFGSKGSGNGQFEGPSGIDFDIDGNTWVTDSGNHRIQKFNPSPSYLEQGGSKGAANGQFEGAKGLAVDPEGNIWVTDTGNNRVQKWYAPARKPTAVTEAATEVKKYTTTLHGWVNPTGQATSYQFEYGPTTAYGSQAPVSPKSLGSNNQTFKVSEALEGLTAGATYHFRIAATNAEGTTYSEDTTFTTKAKFTPTADWLWEGEPLEEQEEFRFEGTVNLYWLFYDAMSCKISIEGTFFPGGEGEVLEVWFWDCLRASLSGECELEYPEISSIVSWAIAARSEPLEWSPFYEAEIATNDFGLEIDWSEGEGPGCGAASTTVMEEGTMLLTPDPPEEPWDISAVDISIDGTLPGTTIIYTGTGTMNAVPANVYGVG